MRRTAGMAMGQQGSAGGDAFLRLFVGPGRPVGAVQHLTRHRELGEVPRGAGRRMTWWEDVLQVFYRTGEDEKMLRFRREPSID